NSYYPSARNYKIEILIWADTGAAGNAPTKSKTRDHPGFQLIYVEASRRPPVVALRLFKMRIAGLILEVD
ncbi:MAG: hypothetical protein NT166_28960, partial [Candidatus Aminicenantes bacterium]|nr:hypothetical protein [Candidatus Aminicenantes bacterium]